MEKSACCFIVRVVLYLGRYCKREKRTTRCRKAKRGDEKQKKQDIEEVIAKERQRGRNKIMTLKKVDLTKQIKKVWMLERKDSRRMKRRRETEK